MPFKHHAFSLLELLITLLIISLLAFFAYPNYQRHLTKTRRIDGQTALLDLAAHLEQFYNQRNTYSDANLKVMGMSAKTSEGFYQLKIQSATHSTYQLAAVPLGAQAKYDTQCGTLQLDSMGQKTATAGVSPSNCW